MDSNKPSELRIRVSEFFPEALAPFVGWTILATTTRPDGYGVGSVQRSALGVLAGAVRREENERGSRDSAYWPRIYFAHGFELILPMSHSDAVLSVTAV